jgi:hypothetical protein
MGISAIIDWLIEKAGPLLRGVGQGDCLRMTDSKTDKSREGSKSGISQC